MKLIFPVIIFLSTLISYSQSAVESIKFGYYQVILLENNTWIEMSGSEVDELPKTVTAENGDVYLLKSDMSWELKSKEEAINRNEFEVKKLVKQINEATKNAQVTIYMVNKSTWNDNLQLYDRRKYDHNFEYRGEEGERDALASFCTKIVTHSYSNGNLASSDFHVTDLSDVDPMIQKGPLYIMNQVMTKKDKHFVLQGIDKQPSDRGNRNYQWDRVSLSDSKNLSINTKNQMRYFSYDGYYVFVYEN